MTCGWSHIFSVACLERAEIPLSKRSQFLGLGGATVKRLERSATSAAIKAQQAVNARMEKDEAITILLREKERISSLLRKKDSQARELSHVLNQRSTASESTPKAITPRTDETTAATSAVVSPGTSTSMSATAHSKASTKSHAAGNGSWDKQEGCLEH